MTMYMDTHKTTDLPNEMREKLQQRVRSGEKDAHGVIDRGIIIDKERGEMHCLLEASGEDAIREHHEDAGMPLESHTLRQADAILNMPR